MFSLKDVYLNQTWLLMDQNILRKNKITLKKKLLEP